MNRRVVGGFCVMAALGLDQGSKALALNTPELGRGVEVLPFLNLVLVRNDGVSFGLLGGVVPWWGLALLAAVIVVWLLNWLWRVQDKLTGAAIGLIIGGALSNVLDRVRYQAVTAFLDFHFRTYHWPSFNLADAAISCGVALLLWSGFRVAKDNPEKAGAGRR